MAENTIPLTPRGARTPAQRAYFSGALVVEDLKLDAERIRDTAWLLASATCCSPDSSGAFNSLGNLLDMLVQKASAEEARLTGCSNEGEA